MEGLSSGLSENVQFIDSPPDSQSFVYTDGLSVGQSVHVNTAFLKKKMVSETLYNICVEVPPRKRYLANVISRSNFRVDRFLYFFELGGFKVTGFP
jgi:hypothetical protein